MAQTDPPPADEGGAEGWVEGFDSAPGNLGPEMYHVFDLALWRFAPAYDDLGALMGFLAWRLDADRLEPAVIDVVYHENRGDGTWPAYAIAGDDLGMMALAVQRLGGVVSDPFRGQEEIAAARAWAVEAEAAAAMLNVSGRVGPVGEPETGADALNLGSMIEGLVEGVAEGDMIAHVVESAEDPVLTRAVFSTLGWRIVPPGGDVRAALTSGVATDDSLALLLGGSYGAELLNSFASMTEPIGYDDAGNPIYPGDEGGGIEELDDGCTELDQLGCEGDDTQQPPPPPKPCTNGSKMVTQSEWTAWAPSTPWTLKGVTMTGGFGGCLPNCEWEQDEISTCTQTTKCCQNNVYITICTQNKTRTRTVTGKTGGDASHLAVGGDCRHLAGSIKTAGGVGVCDPPDEAGVPKPNTTTESSWIPLTCPACP